MRSATALRRLAAGIVGLAIVATATYGGPALAADGFSVDDFAGNAMGTRTLVPGNNTCSPTGGNTMTMGTGTMRINANVPDSLGCNYANAQVLWTADTSVNIEQNGADRIILKYRDVIPNQPSAVTFGLELVDVNGRTANVGGLTRNGGAAGDFLTIRYVPEYVGDVSVLSFQSGFDKGHVKSVKLFISATTNNQNVSVTFEGIGTNVGEPAYEMPVFGNAAAYEFAPSTSTTHSFTVTGNPAPDVTWTGKPSWMTITTSATAGGRLVTMSGNPLTGYTDSTVAFHADVASSLTADASVRYVVPSPVTVTPNATNTRVGQAGPVVVGTVTSTPGSAVVGTPANLPPGTALSVSGTNVVLTGTPTTAGTYAVSATLGNAFRTASFSRDIVVGLPPTVSAIATKNFVRGQAITPFAASVTGYPAPTVTYANLPAGLTASGGVVSGTPTTTSSLTVTATGTNAFGTDSKSFTINVGDVPTITAPADFSVLVGSPVSTPVAVTGAPTSFTATGLPAGLSAQFTGGVASIVGTPTYPASAAAASGTAQLTVTNVFGSETEPMPWTVEAVPTISGPTDVVVSLGDLFSPVVIDFTGYPAPLAVVTDLDGGGRLLPDGLTIDDGTAGRLRIIGTPTALSEEQVRISVSNGVGGTVTHDITISIVDEPAFTDASPSFTVLQGTTDSWSLDWSGYPEPTLSLASPLPSWLTFDPGTGTFNAAPGAAVSGEFGPFQVDATNSGGTASAQVTVRVVEPSTLTAVTTHGTQQGTDFDRSIATVDGFPLPTVTATGLPAGVSLVQSGTDVRLSGASTAPGGAYDVTITATNGVGVDASRSFTVEVYTQTTVSLPSTITLPVGVEASVTPTVGGFPKPVFAAFGAFPPGLTVDSATGEIKGIPTTVGDYSVGLMPLGGYLAPVGPVMTVITVTAEPTFTSTPADKTLRLGIATSGTDFGVGGYPTPTATASGLPAGVTLAQSTNSVGLTGTPTETGAFPVTVTLTSSAGSVERTWNLVVEDPATVTVAPSATVDLGSAITPIPVTTTGYPAPTVTATGLPDGLAIVSDIAGTRISGTPTEDGQFTVELTATNGVGTAGTDTIVIDVESEPSLGGDQAVTFPVGQTTTVTLPVSGYPAPALTVSALPAWLTFNPATATLSGTPTLADLGVADTVTIGAVSSVGSTEVIITPTVTAGPSAGELGGTTTVRSGDTVDEELTTVTGFPAPTVTSAGLPDGLSASVVGGLITLTGETTEAGSHAVTFTLSNGAGADLEVPWTVVVTAPAALATPGDTTIPLGADVDLPIVATGFPAPTLTVTGLPEGLTWEPSSTGGRIVGNAYVATSGTVTVTASNGIGADATATFTVTVELPTIDLNLGGGSVAAGEFLAISATGFQPGEPISVTLHSEPVLLANLTADAAGALNVKVRIPADTEAGSHTIYVDGATGAQGSAPLTVTAADEELSGTGADTLATAALAFAFLIAGAGAVMFARRDGVQRA